MQNCGNLARDLATPGPWVMGILNLTADSFSDGGLFAAPEQALVHARELLESGAALIDIGGESTRPGSQPVGCAEELRRVEPVIKDLAAHAFISVDTYKAAVARRCLELGARMVNDTSALRADAEMAAVVRDFGAYVVLMHSKAEGPLPHATSSPRRYINIVKEIAEYLCRRIDFALAAGIAFDRLIVDPGMGAFISTDPADSWELLSKLQQLREYGITCPMLISTSRKGFLGGALADRDPISQLTALAAVLKGTALIRTHHVAMARSFLSAWTKMFPPAAGAEAGKGGYA